ncbi:MAG: type I restriction endonuclease [Candidatus Bipolaricaulia bacterium]
MENGGWRFLLPFPSSIFSFPFSVFLLYHLADGGTAGYVMANGSMTTNVTEERATRQALIEEGFVDCIVVNQLTVEGQNTRRPDVVVYVNGLPLVIFDLKSPCGEAANVAIVDSTST